MAFPSSPRGIRRTIATRHGAPERYAMWGFLIGLYLAMLIYPFLEEWEQRQADKRRLAKMREHHARGRRWDATKGQWIDQ
jgi:hypothetical protein